MYQLSSLFLLLMIKVSIGKSRDKFLVSFIKMKEGRVQFTTMQDGKPVSSKSKKKCKHDTLSQILWAKQFIPDLVAL